MLQTTATRISAASTLLTTLTLVDPKRLPAVVNDSEVKTQHAIEPAAARMPIAVRHAGSVGMGIKEVVARQLIRGESNGWGMKKQQATESPAV